MYRQAAKGPVDVITGDYLAEINLANNAEAYKTGKHPGWEPTALDGLMQTMKVAAEKGIKIVINGGALNPKGLAEKCQEIVSTQPLLQKATKGHRKTDLRSRHASKASTTRSPTSTAMTSLIVLSRFSHKSVTASSAISTKRTPTYD